MTILKCCYALHSYEGTVFSYDKKATLHNSIHPPGMELNPPKRRGEDGKMAQRKPGAGTVPYRYRHGVARNGWSLVKVLGNVPYRYQVARSANAVSII